MTEFKKSIRTALVALTLPALAVACASPAQVGKMTTDNSRAIEASKTRWAKSLGEPKVTGGEETSPLWVSKVSDNDFKQALTQSLRSNGLLADNPGAAKYRLDVNLLTLSQPLAGIDMTVKAAVQYTLIDAASGRRVLRETISSSYTAKFGDALVAVERLRLANEGAIRKNISDFIDFLIRTKEPIADIALPAT